MLSKYFLLGAVLTPAVLGYTNLCGQWDTENAGIYQLENNLWGMSGYTGSQCSQITGLSGNTISWTTKYTWAGGPYQVKSYSNIALMSMLPKQISSISSIPSVWKWSYSSPSSDLDADVSYDLWLSTSSSGSGASSTSSYEIMIWLSTRGGAGPAGSQIATVTVNGVSWKLYKGIVSTWTVFSYVPVSGELTNFSQDLLPFVTTLTSSYGVSSSQYLVQLQAGTEPFIGSTTLTTSAYSVSINSGTSVPTTTRASSTAKASSSTSSKKTTSTAGSSGGTVPHYGQCGGQGYSGPTACVSPYVCQYSNDWYSQCV